MKFPPALKMWNDATTTILNASGVWTLGLALWGLLLLALAFAGTAFKALADQGWGAVLIIAVFTASLTAIAAMLGLSMFRRHPGRPKSASFLTEVQIGTPRVGPVAPPTFHAVPGMPFRTAQLLVQYRTYSASGSSRPQEALILDGIDRTPGPFAVVHTPLMVRYQNDVGQIFWRWGLDARAPAPDERQYLYVPGSTIDGQVVLRVPGHPDEAYPFKAYPSRIEGASPDFIGQTAFDFVQGGSLEIG